MTDQIYLDITDASAEDRARARRERRRLDDTPDGIAYKVPHDAEEDKKKP
ncbi:hypothetical protein [Streptomyces halobius]|uniref:Uncharacterized protein n=1 Tax=Streptomyces halobius TaxID=2879846 RepID=A0ABY4MK35_9ACTN|nr:hypothetical protein [Streptomyces halobius]UQA98165.1 hypothetical protein K9S39_01030 [Streptomyces halobius]